MRIDESSPLVYLIIVAVAALMVGVVLVVYGSELAQLMRGLAPM